MLVELSVTGNKHTHSLPDNRNILGLWEYESTQLLSMFMKVYLLWTVNFSGASSTIVVALHMVGDGIAICYYGVYVI